MGHGLRYGLRCGRGSGTREGRGSTWRDAVSVRFHDDEAAVSEFRGAKFFELLQTREYKRNVAGVALVAHLPASYGMCGL